MSRNILPRDQRRACQVHSFHSDVEIDQLDELRAKLGDLNRSAAIREAVRRTLASLDESEAAK